MRITVPHMGYMGIALEALLTEFGHEVVLPPPCSKKTLTLGALYSPETVCLPLKMNVGNFLEAVELGADVIVMAGGVGPCRFGYYGEVQKEILRDLGKSVEMLILEPPSEDFPSFARNLFRLAKPRGLRGLLRGMVLAWSKLKACEELLSLSFYVRPRSCHKKEVTALVEEGFSSLLKQREKRNIQDVVARTRGELFKRVTDTAERPLRIGIVGEIYTVVEDSVNLELETRLGDLGVEVTRTISLVHWVEDHLIKKMLGLYTDKALRDDAQGYLRGFVGGHGLESVALTVRLAKQGYDGVIHLYPLTCMPEIVAQSVISAVSKDYGIPVLTLIVDEHTGSSGYQTRLEAFVDLLMRRRGEGVHEERRRILRG